MCCRLHGSSGHVTGGGEEHDASQDVQDEDGDHLTVLCLEDVVTTAGQVQRYTQGGNTGATEGKVCRIADDAADDCDPDCSLTGK